MKNNKQDESLIVNKIFQLSKEKNQLLEFIFDQYKGVIGAHPKYANSNKENLNITEFLEYLKSKTVSPPSSTFPSPPTQNINNLSNNNLKPSPLSNSDSSPSPPINTSSGIPQNYAVLTREQFHFACFECYLLFTHFNKQSEQINAEEEDMFRVQNEISKLKYQQFIKLLTPNQGGPYPLFHSLTYRLWLLKHFNFQSFDTFENLLIWFQRQLYFVILGISHLNRVDPFDEKETPQIQQLKTHGYHLEKILTETRPKSVNDDLYQKSFGVLDQYVGSLLTKNSPHLAKQNISGTDYLNEPIQHIFPLNSKIFEDLLFYSIFEFKEDQILFIGDEHSRISPILKPISKPLKISVTMEKISHLNCFLMAYQAEPNNSQHFKRVFTSLQNIQELIESNIQIMITPDQPNNANLLKLSLKNIANWLIKLLSDVHMYKGDNPVSVIDLACNLYNKSREMWGLLSTSKTNSKTTESNYISFITSSVSAHYSRISRSFRPITLDNFSEFVELLATEIQSDLLNYSKGFQKHIQDARKVALTEYVNLYSFDLKVVFADIYFLSPMVLKSTQTASKFQLQLEDLKLIDREKLPPVKDYVSTVITAWCQNQEKAFNQWFENSFKLDKFIPVDKSFRHSTSVLDMFQMFYQTIGVLSKMRGALGDNFPMFILTLSSMFNNCLLIYNQSIAEMTLSNQKHLLYPLSLNERVHTKGKVRRSLSLSNPLGNSTSSNSSTSSSSSTANSGNNIFEAKNSLITPALQSKLQSISITTSCVCLNNLDFILKNLNQYIEEHSYSNVELNLKLTELFGPVSVSISNTCKSIIDFIGTRVVFYELKSVIIDSTYLAPLVENSNRISNTLDSMNPFLKVIYSTVQTMERSNDILHVVCKSFIKAMEWILLYSGPSRIYQPKDISMIEYDLELIKDFFLDKDSEGKTHGVSEKEFDKQLSKVMKIVNLLMEMGSDILVDQFTSNSTNPNNTNTLNAIGLLNNFKFSNDIILSVLLHRNDKVAKTFIKKKEGDPMFNSIKKGSKVNFLTE